MRLLVVGGDRVDAGKTTFATGLLAHLRGDGHAPVGFKPRAGNDYWFDHDDVRATVGEGRLYGKDARRLAATSAGDTDPETLNPVHRLWTPTPGETGMLGDPERTFLVDRVTGDSGPEFVVNGTVDLPDLVVESLPLGDSPRVYDVPEFNELMADRYVPAFDRLRRRVGATETAVIESYGDIALPLSEVGVDAVAAVRAGRARVFDGSRFLKAREVTSGSPHDGRLEERVGNVVSRLDPLAAVELPALASEERRDPSRVAARYASAYEALVEAA
ncbi:ATPase [Halobium salinum]|uniref:ATPase n=1 Tax=Halobium salinum TaxID=1364940 RepID=A0ABD5PDZ7_9EURY|nr:ATPase [Halobium salinum]